MDYLEDFLDFCEYRRGLSKNTIMTYRYTLVDFLEWVKGRNLDPVSVKVKEIDAYLIHLRKDKENSVRSMNSRMYGLKTFYRWLQRIEAIERNPLDLFQNTKEPKNLPEYLTVEQQKALIAAQNGDCRRTGCDWITQRDRLLILLLLDTGLRISEAVNIRVEDFDLTEGILKVRGKGDKERLVVLSNRVITAIKEYLKTIDTLKFDGTIPPGLCSRGFNLSKICRELGISRTGAGYDIYQKLEGSKEMKQIQEYVYQKIKPLPLGYLFPNLSGRNLGTRHAFRIIQDIGRKAGIKDLHPHLLRHTHATNLRRKGGDLLLIKEALGHASVMTTEIYAHLGNEEYKNKLRELINEDNRKAD